MQLAEQRGEAHIGGDAVVTINKRRLQKQQTREAQREHNA